VVTNPAAALSKRAPPVNNDSLRLVSRLGNKFSIADAAFDLVGRFGPHELLSVLVPMFQEAGDGAFKFGRAVETAPKRIIGAVNLPSRLGTYNSVQ
jgi:hypothetical protein